MNRIIQGAKEALAIAKGEMDPKEYAVHVPENVDVRQIREKMQSITPATPWRVVKAEALPGYRIKVWFQDGLEGVVDMAELIRSPKAGVFADLQDVERFQSLFVELGVVTWPDGQDLAPDAMHAAIKQHGQWVLS